MNKWKSRYARQPYLLPKRWDYGNNEEALTVADWNDQNKVESEVHFYYYDKF